MCHSGSNTWCWRRPPCYSASATRSSVPCWYMNPTFHASRRTTWTQVGMQYRYCGKKVFLLFKAVFFLTIKRTRAGDGITNCITNSSLQHDIYVREYDVYGITQYLMPHGLSSAQAVFQCLTNDVLREKLVQFVITYNDDILMYSLLYFTRPSIWYFSRAFPQLFRLQNYCNMSSGTLESQMIFRFTRSWCFKA